MNQEVLIFESCIYDDVKAVKTAILSGIDVNKTSQTGRTPLHYCTLKDSVKCLRYLLTVDGIEINKKDDRERNTALHIAVSYGYTKSVKILLASPSIDIFIKNDDGNTPLHIAAKYDTRKCLNLMLSTIERGCNYDVSSSYALTNNKGKTFLDYIKDEKYKKRIIKMMGDDCVMIKEPFS